MLIAAFLPIGFFVVVLAFVGIRLLALARRTRQLPELALGSGLLLIAFVGMPLSAAGRAPGIVGTPLGHTLFAIGIMFVVCGAGNLFVFTWKVFRPRDKRAAAFVAAAWMVLLLLGVSIATVTSRSAELAEILMLARPWSLAIMGALALQFSWSGAESIACYRKARRRLALGLADPVVVNRFLLWGISSVSAALLCGGLILCALANLVIVRDTIPLTILAATGTITCLTWSLTFFPPRVYQKYLRSRAG